MANSDNSFNQPLVIDRDEVLDQLFAWVILNVQVKSLTPVRPVYSAEDSDNEEEEVDSSPADQAYLYDFTIVGNSLDDYFEGEDCEEGEEDTPPKWLIPENLTLESLLHLTYPLVIYNLHGANNDKRGTKFPAVEFGDFHPVWQWKQGPLTLRQFAEGIFRLKSHKFENWYEWVHTGLLPLNPLLSAASLESMIKNPTLGRHYRSQSKTNTLLTNMEDGTLIFRAQLSVDHGS